jgi:hypothetical protein
VRHHIAPDAATAVAAATVVAVVLLPMVVAVAASVAFLSIAAVAAVSTDLRCIAGAHMGFPFAASRLTLRAIVSSLPAMATSVMLADITQVIGEQLAMAMPAALPQGTAWLVLTSCAPLSSAG